MLLTRTEVEEEFVVYFVDIRDALKAEGERVDKAAEWQSFIVSKVNARQLRPESMHWNAPRIVASTRVADFA